MELIRWTWPRVLITALAAVLLCAQAASAETVVARKRLGNNVEGLTYDPLNDRAVAMDGNDVIGIALNPLDAAVLATMRNDPGGIVGIGYRKLFDVLALPLEARVPRGIAYVPPLQRYFYTTDLAAGTGAFYSTDEHGHPFPAIVLKGLSQPVDFWEGIAWIPPGAPAHGGTLAALGGRNADFVSHVFYVRPDGTVEAEVVPQPGTPIENFLCGISYWPDHPSQLLVGDCFSGFYAMDARTGAIIGDGQLFPNPPGVPDAENVIVRRDGSLMVSGYAEGRLYAYDRALHRKAGEDRSFTIGLGTSFFFLGWNSDDNEFIGLSQSNSHVYAVSADLQSARVLFDVPVTNETPNAGSIFYLGNNQVGLGNRGYPRGIDIAQIVSDRFEVPNGTSVSRLLFSPSPDFPPGQAFNIRGFSLLDPNTFVVRAIGDTSALKVVTRGGTPDTSIYRDGVIPARLPDIVLSSPTAGVGAQVYDNGSGKRIFTGAEIYGIDGTLIHRIDWQQLGLNQPASDGVWIGGNTFATVDGQTSTVVIYSVP
jgi:hypothetical protein